MPSEETNATADDEPSERFLTLIGVGAGLVQFVAFTAVGVLALENVVYSGIIGLFAGVGSFLFIPWFVGLSAVQEAADGDVSLSAATERVSRSTQRGLIGFGLEAGAIVMIAVAFALDGADFLVGVPAALAVALAIYFVGSVVIGR
ncbi:putative membrane protein [Halorubrum alkaliphilum]|uniref:Putative membrane protein n=1 Tax=Halorubrum alkaliphilum TaxID=261290 RepID=A0A8T4GE20_9EURY|nr:hypothetical protein [Halorubrum alkaliphilum]MBP1921979.1 putative membrane protein [Halorubrum alkaliphilum]